MNEQTRRLFDLYKLNARNRSFTENEISVIRFLLGFVAEGIKRALEPPPSDENTAVLDAYGRIVSAGTEIKRVLLEILGEKFGNSPGYGGDSRSCRVFLNGFRNFLYGPHQPGCGEIYLNGMGGTYRFTFSLLSAEKLCIHFPREPQVKMTLWGTDAVGDTDKGIARFAWRFYAPMGY